MVAAPAFVRVVSQGVITNAAGFTSAVFAAGATTAAGNALVLCATADNGAVTAVSDADGNTYTVANGFAGKLAAASLVSGHNVTVTLNATTYRFAYLLLEFSGAASAGTWNDGVQTSSLGTATLGPLLTASGAPGQGTDLIIDQLVWRDASVYTYNPTWTPTSPWVDRGHQTAGLNSVNGSFKAVGLGVATRAPGNLGPFALGGSVSATAGQLQATWIALRGVAPAAPNAPTAALRTGFPAASIARFSWTFTDADVGDTQGWYQLLVLRASDNATIYDSGKLASANAYHDVPANTLANGTTYYWKVRTWDNWETIGPYATANRFTPTLAPSAAIDAPLAAAVIGSTPVTVAWTYSGTLSQGAYQVRLLIGGVEQSTTGKVSNGATRSVAVAVLTATSYTVELTVWDTQDQPSTPVTVAFTTSFLAAVTPSLTATAVPATAHVALAWTSGAPGGGQAATASVDLYRAPHGTTTWTRIATGQAASGSYADYGVGDELTYDYKATGISTAGSTADSATQSPSAITITDGIWLHAVSNPAATARNYRYDKGGHGDSLGPVVQLVRFDGRTYPVAEFDATAIDEAVTCSLLLPWDLGGTVSSDRVALEALARRRETVCYRDHRSRVVFGVLGPLQFTDVFRGYTVSLTVTRTGYREDAT